MRPGEGSLSELTFIDHDRGESGYWAASDLDPAHYHDCYIITKDCFLELSYDGDVRYKRHFVFGTVIQSSPNEKVQFSGIGPARFLQIRFLVDSLPIETNNDSGDKPQCAELQVRIYAADVGLGVLALNHQAAYDAKISLESPYLSALRKAMLTRISAIWSRDITIAKGRSEMFVPAKTRRVINYIEANLKQHLTLSHLSVVAGVSRAHFARAFRNSIGMSPHQFVRHRRLAAAMRLIWTRKYTLAEIAHSCGFADQAHLTRTFRSQYGNVPTYFAKLHPRKASTAVAQEEILRTQNVQRQISTWAEPSILGKSHISQNIAQMM